jgi:tellurite resistance protein
MDRYANLWPWILDLEHSVLDADELQLVLGSLANQGKSAPARVAREIAFNEPEAARSNVATRSPAEFRRLFDQRIVNEFPNGLPLRLGQRPALARYLPASAALRCQADNDKGTFVARTAYVSVDASERLKLVNLWNACCGDLSGYVRAKAKAVGKSIDLATLIATPPELRSQQAESLSRPFEDVLATAARDESFRFIAVGSLCNFFGVPAREKYTTTQSRQVAEGLECLGWLVEPDPRTHGASFAAAQEVVLFQGDDVSPSPGFLGRCALVQMAATVASADDSFDLREHETISMLIDNSESSEGEKLRLRAWSFLLGRNLDSAPATITKVAKAVPAEKSQAVAQMLCRLATADSIVTKNEERMLARIFRNLGLNPETTAALMKELDGFDDVAVSTATEPAPGEAIPQPSAKTQPRFALDRARIQALAKETAEVIGILSVAMADAEHEVEVAPSVSVQAVVVESPSWCEALNPQFVPLLLRLIEKDSWTRVDFDSASTDLHLMPNAAYDAINEWSDETLGDFLLEGDDLINVNRSLVPA